MGATLAGTKKAVGDLVKVRRVKVGDWGKLPTQTGEGISRGQSGGDFRRVSATGRCLLPRDCRASQAAIVKTK